MRSYDMGIKIWVLIICVGASMMNLHAEDKDEETTLDEIIVTATRHETELFNTPVTAQTINVQDIQSYKISRSLPEIFKEVPSVLVQKTSHGQGSPFIRGFTGFRTLFMIDGIRLNNSVFRSGPNQYWNTVDPLTIQRLEIVKGPSSVLYGSDAIGGTVNAITLYPQLSDKGLLANRRVYYRYGSAEDANVGRLELSGSHSDLTWLAGGSSKGFGDVVAGREIGLQTETNYREKDGDFKMVYSLSSHSDLTLAYQQVNQDNVPRTEKTIYSKSFHDTTVGSELKRDHFQDRKLTYLKYQASNLDGFIDSLQINLSYHYQAEERHRIKGNGQSDRQGFDVRTTGLGIHLGSPGKWGLFTYGIEYYHDNVTSFNRKYNADGTLKSIEIQGPVADDATYDLLGLYIQNERSLSEQIDLTLGLRYTKADADADKVDIDGVESSIDDSWNNMVGSARLLYHINKKWNGFFGISQGFRAPNFGDLTTLDATSAVEKPTIGLDPEKFTSFEIGLKKRPSEKWSSQISYWYTLIDDMIVQSPTGAYESGVPVVVKDNVGDGYVHGLELMTRYRIQEPWTLFGNLTSMYGKVTQFDVPAGYVKKDAPLSRLMPLTVNLGTRYQPADENYWIEGVLTLVDKADKLALRDKTDTNRIPPDGTPGYGVVTLRGGTQLSKHLNLSIAIENLTNKDYRIHGSGQNEPGTNFVLSLNSTF